MKSQIELWGPLSQAERAHRLAMWTWTAADPKPGCRPGQPPRHGGLPRAITLKPKGPLALETSRHHLEVSTSTLRQ